MKKMWKRFVSLLLACTLLAGMLPLSASAQATEPTETEWIKNIISDLTKDSYDLQAKTQLGESDVWMYIYYKSYWDGEAQESVNDTVFIFQPGQDAASTEIPNYDNVSAGQPWSLAKPSAIYIAEGVTGIGNYAFASQPSLNNVVFQDASDLTYIGQRAFYDDDNAVFTDEGNGGDNAPLDLSGVTRMGEYAFYNCDRLTGVELGNMTAIEGNEEIANKIPNNAFNNSGLQTVTIPDGIVHIGDGAFGHTSLSAVGELVLPSGLQTIGDNAFVVTEGSGDTSVGITSLTIPSSVKSIGENAFSGRRQLAEVTVEDDNKPGTTLELGNHAFGHNESSAFSEYGSITDAQNNITYRGTIGTKFYLPEDLVDTFKNGENCYTGDIEPMKWVKTQQPTCDTDGWHLYETTMKGAYDDEGKPLVLQYKYTIPMLGHDWDEGNLVTVAATCETPSYKYEPCTRGCGEINIIDDHVADALSHNYQVNENGGVMNPGIKKSNNTPTTVTYTCQNYKDGDGNLHDGDLDASYTWTIPATTLSATTSDTLADLQLPSVTGSTQASLAWADSVTTTEKLTEGTSNYQVKLVVSNDANFKPYTNADFTIEVKVEKTKLDFSEVYFENSTRWINGNTPEFSVEGMPEGTSEVKIEYKKKNEENAPWTTEKPKEEAVGDAGDYLVRYTFSYDPAIYDLVTNDPELSPPDDYTLEKAKDKDGEGTITGDYRVAQMTMESVKVSAINNLVFNGTHENIDGEAQPTVQLEGVLLDSKVTFTWTEDEKQVTETIDPTEAANFSGAKITNAGTYKVAIKIEKENYVTVDREVFVTIAKQPLTAPRAESNLRYDTTEKTGVPDSTDNRYTVSGNKQTNAGTYKAEAKVVNSKNYQWPEAADPDGDGTAEISWQILHRLTAKPTIPISQYQYEEETYRQPVTTTSKDIVISYEDDKLVATFRGQTAYTATNAKETNADDYTVTVHLENNNYKWADDQSTTDLTLSWRITPLQIAAPTITAPSATYTGEAYAGQVTLEHSKASDSRGSSQDIIDLDKTKSNIRYYTQQTGGTGGSAPVNAGTYFAGVESNGWAFVDGKLATNYQILGGSRAPFSISKAIATMEFSQKEVSATYTAQGTDLQQVTVDGLVDADKDKPASDVYTVTYTYKYRNDNTDWEEVKTETTIEEPSSFKFTDVGEYQITATFSSQNYTAADATYTLTITQANDQKITLTSAETNAGKWDVENNSYTTIYGSEKTFTVTGKAALDKENADISYAVNGDSNVVSVDGSSGVVTIHKAGTATITVTAADTDNVTGTSVNYTVTVNRAKPTVNTGLPDDELTVAYTGEAITDTEYNKATATANVVKGADQPTGDITYTFYADQECKNKVTNGGGEENNIPIAVGTYYMKATYPGDKNYLPAESKVVTVTVTKAQLTVDAEGHTGTYDGKTHDAITVNSVTGNSEEITGYTVKYAVTNNDTAPNENAGEEVWKGTLPVKDVADSTSENLYYWYMVTADNYNPAIGEVEVKIAPAPLTVAGEPTHYTKEYDGDKTVDETFDEITVTAKDVPEVTIDVDATGTYDNENAGEGKNVTLTLTLSGTDGTEIDWDNYSYNGAAPTDGKITLTKDDAGTITPKAITVTGISAVNRVYDGTKVVQLTGTPETEDTVEGDNLTLTLTGNATGSIADANVDEGKDVTVETSVITLGGTDKDNYTVKEVKYDATTGLTVNITQRPVNLEFAGIGQDDRTIEKPYTGQPVSVTVGPVTNPDEETGFVDSDQLTAADVYYTYTPVDPTTDTNHTAVGSYTVTAALKAAPTGDYGNYELNFPAEATLKITPAEMVVTAKDYTGTYTGKAHDVTASWTAKTTAGDQPITITGVQFIKKDEQHNTKPEADAEGWAAISFIDVAKSGEYWYKVTAENYAPIVGDSAVTITIDPATLTINRTVTPTKTYDGTVGADGQVTGVSVTGQQNNEAITATVTSAVYDSAEVGSASKITITYTLSTEANLGNYKYKDKALAADTQTVSETVSDCSITQAPVTVTISDQTSVYDGKTVTPIQTEWKVSDNDLFDVDNDGTKDNLGIALSIASGSKDAGTYAITGEWTNSNYDVIFTGSWTGEDENKDHAGTYTIDHRPIDVQIGDAEGFYGDAPDLTLETKVILTPETAQGEEAGLVNGENIYDALEGLSLGSNATVSSSVGENYIIYPLNDEEPVLNDNGTFGNYNVTFTNEGTYTVKPRPITITIKDHSSVYGEKIADGITNPVFGTDYQVSLTEPAYTGSGESAIVNNDALTVTLNTTASATAAAGAYDIIGSVTGDKVNNYAITWAGNGGDRDDGGKNGKYTIEQAELAISFEKGNQVPNGVSINITDSYKDNPLVLKNDTTKTEVSTKDKKTLTIKYSIGLANGGTGDVSDIATINETTGEVTIHSTGTVRVTAKVTANEGSNYTGTQTTWYELNIIGGGQMALRVTPATGLKYTGVAQELLASEASCTVAGAEIQYSLDNQDWDDEIPTGTNAGTYTVYVKATDPNDQYSDVTEHVTVTISKANLKGSFAQEEYTHVLTKGNSYDSATANELTISSAGYGAEPAKYTYRSADTTVAMAENGGSTIRIMGSAGQETTITVTVPGDNNYNEGTFTYTLKISDDLSKIKYNVTGITTTYNGQPQTIEVNVSVPASGATVKYWNEETKKYDLSEPPAYTNVQDDGYTIKFQITAPGYETVDDGTATLTINPKPIKKEMIAGIAESYTYTGSKITFDDAISVHDEGVLLTKGKDYTISYDDNTAVGTGTVTITGTGNYKESVTKNFTISPVDASDLTASLNRTFGYYGDSDTNNATVKVMHGNLHEVDSSEIELTVTRKDDTSASSDVTTDDLKLTFNKAGIYTIHVEVSGTHTGTFDLTYTLLPQDVASDDFQVATDPVDRVWTYDGENHAFGVTVTSGGTSLQKDVDFTLHYTYLPYVGNPTDDVYDPGTTAFTEAGIYTVIVEGTGNYTGHAELVALIQPRDLSDAGIAAAFAQTELVYNGEAQEPGVTLTYNGTAITQLKDTEYYGNTNAGEAQALSAAREDCNNFTGARVDAFTIEKKSLKDSTITAKADPEEYYYTGYPVTPAVTVTDSDRNVDLSIGADYTVSSDAVGPGKVTATVTGTGNYKDTVTVEFTILPTGAEPVETLNLTVTPSEWTWDNGQTKAAISVTFNGTELNDTDYQLTVSKDGETPQTVTKAEAVELLSAPGEYTITATGVGAYNGSTDTETVTIQKIQPEVTVTATPNSLSGGGKVTLTLKGEKLPDGMDLKNLLKVTAKNDSDVTLEDLHIQWPQDGSLTAELTLPNTNETYTFTLSFVGNDYYESASSTAMVVVGQQTSGGGGGSDPGDQPADPDDTGVSDWLNTKEHLAYLAGYPGGTFGPDQNMTRAEAAQMFYNLLLEKDVEITVEFEDVPADAWYAKPVNTLASLGILSGVGNGRFDPERSITRAEFTVIAMKFANTSGGGVNIFSDVNEDDWFYSAVVDSTQYGWINGYPDGTFRPEATISRAEVTVIVNHMLGRAADRPYVIAHEEELNTFGDVNRGHWGYFHVAEATNAHEYHTEDGTESWTGLS